MNPKNENKILVKNMVCQRCIMIVEAILQQQQIPFQNISLGEVELAQPLDDSKRHHLETELKKYGFELIEARVNKIVENIKKVVLNYLANEDDHKLKLSSFITRSIHYDYSYLSDLFSSIEGITIEQYFIIQRIEKVKELLVYQELSLADIAFQTGFSSTAHLSAQFKKITGLTPTHFKKIGAARRKAIDHI
jgi:AraC family transcriptional regulator